MLLETMALMCSSCGASLDIQFSLSLLVKR
jgi:hypothetical protein